MGSKWQTPGFQFFTLMVRIMLGLRKQKNILEDELAGEIESVGKDVKLFRKCDQVYGTTTYR